MNIMPVNCSELGWRAENSSNNKTARISEKRVKYNSTFSSQNNEVSSRVTYSVLELTDQCLPEEFMIEIRYPANFINRFGKRIKFGQIKSKNTKFCRHNESIFLLQEPIEGSVTIYSLSNPSKIWKIPFQDVGTALWDSIEIEYDRSGALFNFESSEIGVEVVQIVGDSHVGKKRDKNGKWKKELKELFGNCDLDLMKKRVSIQKSAPFTRLALPKKGIFQPDGMQFDVIHQICYTGEYGYGYVYKSLLLISKSKNSMQDLPVAKGRQWKELEIEISPKEFIYIYTLDLVKPRRGDSDGESIPIVWPSRGVNTPRIVRSPNFVDEDQDGNPLESIRRNPRDKNQWDLTIEGSNWGVEPK